MTDYTSSVTRIGSRAFFWCSSLSAITVEALNPYFSSQNGILFDKNQTVLIQCPAGKAGTYAVSNSVTSIGNWAFSACTFLTNVSIPQSVTNIGDWGFYYCTSLTSVSIPNSVLSLGSGAFSDCYSLSNAVISDKVTRIQGYAFYHCNRLTSITIPNKVTSIGNYAFSFCSDLSSVVIPPSVTIISDFAFSSCSNLMSAYFLGNAPSSSLDGSVFHGVTQATAYYLPGTTGWGVTYGGLPTVLWNPQVLTSNGSFGVQTNGFGFTITGSSNLVIVVEACTNLASTAWSPVGTNTLTGGSSYFSDPKWTNSSARFYRLRSP